MTLLSIPAAAELLEDTERHVLALIEAGELDGVDIANHKAKGTVQGADGIFSPCQGPFLSLHTPVKDPTIGP